jgi:hypothetical protein
MTRIQWLECWDELRERIQTGNTSWGRNQILDLMIDIERRKVRQSEAKFQQDLEITAARDRELLGDDDSSF